jgi:hypothetical protein
MCWKAIARSCADWARPEAHCPEEKTMPLPDMLKFLYPGWWMVHVAAIWIAYRYGFNAGRGSARREQRVREMTGK